jgi:tRNA(Arg) A34 adenosine deaminase TadA
MTHSTWRTLSKPSEVILIRSGRGLRLKIHKSWSLYASAYEHLIHLLYHYVDVEAQWWSRAKAYTTDQLSPSMWGLMKVAGKRLYHVDSTTLESHWSELTPVHRTVIDPITPSIIDERLKQFIQRLTTDPIVFTDICEASCWLNDWVQTENHRLHLLGQGESQSMHRRWGGTRRVVGALALDEAYRMITYTLNQPKMGHTAHAECVLFTQLSRDQLWPQSKVLTLITTLKPCKMCAGLWASHAPCDQLNIVYLHNDPGPNGQNTAFDQNSYAWGVATKWSKSVRDFNQSSLMLKFSSLPINSDENGSPS